MIEDTSEELHRKYRPRAFKHVIGQPDAVGVLSGLLTQGKLPHALLMSGASGCGKTTLARIVARKLQCGDADLVEINAADARGIDTIREIGTRVRNSPISGKVRMWIIDEAHKLSNDAQNALLKILEELPAHSYIILCTTDPAKLIRTIITRCMEIRVRELGDTEMKQLVEYVAEKESIKLHPEASLQLLMCAFGSARMALVLLQKISVIEDEQEQIDVLYKMASQQEGFALARCIFDFRSQFPDAAKILLEMKDEPESVRYVVLAYSRSILLKGGKMAARAAFVISVFQFETYNSKHAGLALMTYTVMTAKR